MGFETAAEPTAPGRGARVALIFALLAERLSLHYEHGQWLTEAQGASLVADWLTRSKRSLSLSERKHLSALSDQLARQMADLERKLADEARRNEELTAEVARLRKPLALEATPAEATPEKNYVGLCSLMAGEQEARKSD